MKKEHPATLWVTAAYHEWAEDAEPDVDEATLRRLPPHVRIARPKDESEEARMLRLWDIIWGYVLFRRTVIGEVHDAVRNEGLVSESDRSLVRIRGEEIARSVLERTILDRQYRWYSVREINDLVQLGGDYAEWDVFVDGPSGQRTKTPWHLLAFGVPQEYWIVRSAAVVPESDGAASSHD